MVYANKGAKNKRDNQDIVGYLLGMGEREWGALAHQTSIARGKSE